MLLIMKRIIFTFLLLFLASGTDIAATPAQAPVKQVVSKNTKVYYVVVQSFSTLEGAKEFLRICPDAIEGPIYEASTKGKKVYRVCVACYYKKSDAAENARAINEFLNIGAWVWSNNGLAKCVERGVGLNGEPHRLAPQ